MKTLSYFFILSLFTLFACNRIDTTLIEGTWQEIDTGDSTYEFTSDGKYKIEYKEDEDENDQGTYSVTKRIITTKSDLASGQETYRIQTLEENKMVLDQNDLFTLTFIRIK